MSALGFIALAFILHTVLTVLASRRSAGGALPSSGEEDRDAYERLHGPRQYEHTDVEPAGSIAAATYAYNNGEFAMSDDLPGFDTPDDHFGDDSFDSSSWDDRS